MEEAVNYFSLEAQFLRQIVSEMEANMNTPSIAAGAETLKKHNSSETVSKEKVGAEANRVNTADGETLEHTNKENLDPRNNGELNSDKNEGGLKEAKDKLRTKLRLKIKKKKKDQVFKMPNSFEEFRDEDVMEDYLTKVPEIDRYDYEVFNDGNKEAINPFVDETFPESDNVLVKHVVSKEEVEMSVEVILESVEQASEEENSNDDLDINAGLDEWFSYVEKVISKDESSESPSPFAVNNLEKKPEDTNEDKTVGDSYRETTDVITVPSEGEKGGNEADEENIERLVFINLIVCNDNNLLNRIPVEQEEPVDLDQALGELEMIVKTTRRILNNEEESLKTPNEESIEPVSKKLEVDEIQLKKDLKKMSRNDLENLTANKMVEGMTNMRHQCDSFQETFEKWKRRDQALSKQCTDLSMVMRKYITDSNNRPRDMVLVAPVRINRSVGLQVGNQVSNINIQKQGNGFSKVITISPQLPRTLGSTTISPAKETATPIRSTGSVITRTPYSSSTPKPVTDGVDPLGDESITDPPLPKPVIDVVDLSDDESTPTPPTPKPTPQPVRQVPSVMVRS